MARCGCATTCACSVVADPDGCTSVTGNGAPGSPYTVGVTVDPACDLISCGANGLCVEPAAFMAVDSTTIDHTLTGSGSAADPYSLSSAVILTPDGDVPEGGTAGNLVKVGPTGIYVSCEDVQDCVGQMMTALLDGIRYDDAGNAVIVAISTDAGNQVTYGADGGLFVPANPVLLDCGLVADPGTGAIGTNTPAAWPFACADTNGADVYCGADGQLRTDPPHACSDGYVGVGGTQTLRRAELDALGNGTSEIFRDDGVLVVNNPSPCRPMRFEVETGGRVRADIEVGEPRGIAAHFNAGNLGIEINGAPTLTYGNGYAYAATRESGATSIFEQSVPATTVAAGGAVSFNRVGFYNAGTGGNTTTTLNVQLPSITATGRTC